MYLSTFRVTNYKSILDSTEIPLGPSFNVVVGQNNAGKSSLVEALGLRFGHRPHRSMATLPRPSSQPHPHSRIDISAELQHDELHEVIVDSAIRHWSVLAPEGVSHHQFAELITIDKLRRIHATYVEGRDLVGSFFGPALKEREGGQNWWNISYNPETRLFDFDSNGARLYNVLPDHLAERLRERVYTFRAERMNVGRGVFGHNAVLQPHAQNLPTVLALLQSNPERFRRYNDAVSTVFPEIQHISVDSDPSTQGAGIQIKVWTIPPVTERDDLAVPLTESGTGISQVLAILYVVLTASAAQTIVVDEPQSFLHPGAARKLIEVLKQYPHHQFIFTTHSATIITAAQPDMILLMRKEHGQSSIQKIDPENNNSLRALLMDIGARLTDVFGADDILWVEGPTEEICLPMILSRHLHEPLFGTQVMGVARTGDFDGKQAGLVLEIYEKLTAGPSLLPPAFGFMFDRENRTHQQRDDLQRRARGRIVFTQRRLYENYLLVPAAIAEVASAIPGFRDVPLTAEQVHHWIEEHVWDRTFWPREIPMVDRDVEYWRMQVHGAKLLSAIFSHFSDNRVSFDKVRDSVGLTRWILDHQPEELAEFADSVQHLRNTKPRVNA